MSYERSPEDRISPSAYAGFWRRFVALVIDYHVVVISLFPLFVLLGLMMPKQVVVYVPFGWFSPEAVVDSTSEEVVREDGSVVVEESRIIRQEVMGNWTYFYKETATRSRWIEEAEGVSSIDTISEADRVLIDVESGNHLDWMELDDVVYWFLILYWSLMESSKFKASVGKLALGIQVTDKDGSQLTLMRALGRNISKFLSMFTLLIGFMMAGWTSKKQGLHDLIARCYVVLK